MGKEPYSTRVRRLSELQKEACETYHAAFVDTVKVLADAQGNYTTFKVDDKGRHVRLRYKDMVHVTEDGGAMLSAAVEPVVEKELLLGRNKAAERPAPQALPSSASSSPLPAESALPAVAEASAEQGGIPFTVDSMFRGGKIPCYAFLPADRKPGERFPVDVSAAWCIRGCGRLEHAGRSAAVEAGDPRAAGVHRAVMRPHRLVCGQPLFEEKPH